MKLQQHKDLKSAQMIFWEPKMRFFSYYQNQYMNISYFLYEVTASEKLRIEQNNISGKTFF